eukprot:GGOE01006311.1.p1 GENE.GGOE01006311.1~~GGOE01006311.1.p1  ORF type:complete len:524 (-),score=75.84 GGOE01006311.1:1047-2618(-)
MEQYSKIKNIGKGNMGQCIQVRRNDDGQILVMKLIDLSKMNKKERTASLNEAKVLSFLKHPNIIRYADSFLSRKTEHLCIVMEFAEGGDLANKIKLQRGRPFLEEVILDWFIQICLGLQACHKKKILHRDVKTQNIFLAADGVIKVGDFGISRILQNTMDNAHTFVGTPYYLSPELVQERPYNMSSDIWALGVVLYELMSLRHPFNATDMKGLMSRILRAIFDPPPPFYCEELRAIVPMLLQKDPARRPKVGDILELPIVQRRLRTLVDGSAHSSLPASYFNSLIQMGVIEDPNAPSDEDSSYTDPDSGPQSQGSSSVDHSHFAPPPEPSAWIPPRLRDIRLQEQRAAARNAAPEPNPPPKGLPGHLPPLGGRFLPRDEQKSVSPVAVLLPVVPVARPSITTPSAPLLPPISKHAAPAALAEVRPSPGCPSDPGPRDPFMPPSAPPRRNLLANDAVVVPRQTPPTVSAGGSDLSSAQSRFSHYAQYAEARRQAEINRQRANSKYGNIVSHIPLGVAQHDRGWR